MDQSGNLRKIYCLGSLNIDHIYKVKRVLSVGESGSAEEYGRYPGGKGLNQAYTIFKAGVKELEFIAIAGSDGAWIKAMLQEEGFPANSICIHSTELTGNVVIQISDSNLGDGENTALLYLGANIAFTEELIRRGLMGARNGDVLLIQSESNLVDYAIKYERVSSEEWRSRYPCDWLVVNKNEHCHILGESYPENDSQAQDQEARNALTRLKEYSGVPNVLITLGAQGIKALSSNDIYYSIPATPASSVVDTTGAGDTFLGYFVAIYFAGLNPVEHKDVDGFEDNFEFALKFAATAAALSVTKVGAIASIPRLSDVIHEYQKAYQSSNGL